MTAEDAWISLAVRADPEWTALCRAVPGPRNRCPMTWIDHSSARGERMRARDEEQP